MNHVETRISKKMVFLLMLLFLLLAVDTILVLLSINQYFFIFFNSSVWFIPILFNIAILTLILVTSKKWNLLIYISMLIMCLIVFHIGFSFMDWDYDYVDSPKGTETLIIKHRVATLGESNYFYEFYQKSFLGIVMKKLTEQELAIVVHDHKKYPNAQKTLGFDHPTWLNEKEVTFESKDGRKEITLH